MPLCAVCGRKSRLGSTRCIECGAAMDTKPMRTSAKRRPKNAKEENSSDGKLSSFLNRLEWNEYLFLLAFLAFIWYNGWDLFLWLAGDYPITGGLFLILLVYNIYQMFSDKRED